MGQIYYVTGPPCGGKTYYVDTHRSNDDVVIDVDRLRVALGGDEYNPGTQHAVALKIAGQALWEARNLGYNVWFISVNKTPQVQYDDMITVDPGIEVCFERAKEQRPSWTLNAIRKWYAGSSEGTGRAWLL